MWGGLTLWMAIFFLFADILQPLTAMSQKISNSVHPTAFLARAFNEVINNERRFITEENRNQK